MKVYSHPSSGSLTPGSVVPAGRGQPTSGLLCVEIEKPDLPWSHDPRSMLQVGQIRFITKHVNVEVNPVKKKELRHDVYIDSIEPINQGAHGRGS